MADSGTLSIRLALEGGDQVRSQLQQIANEGEGHFRRLGDSAEQASAKLERAFSRLSQQLDPAIQAQQRLASGSSTLDRALSAGLTTQAQHDALLQKLTGRYKDVASGAVETGGKIEGFREILRGTTEAAAGNLLGVSRAGAYLANTFGLLESGPAVAILAIASALAIGTVHANTLESETRKLAVALQGMGRDAGVSSGQLRELATQLGRVGVARGEALAGIETLTRSGAFGAAQIPGVAALGADIAAGQGISFADAINKLIAAAQRGYPAIQQLDQAWTFLTADELKSIRAMAQHGDQAGALATAMAALQRRFGSDATKSMTEFQKTTGDLGVSWEHLLDSFSKSSAIQTVLRDITELVSGLARLVELADKVPAWLRGKAAAAGVSTEGLPSLGDVLGKAVNPFGLPTIGSLLPGSPFSGSGTGGPAGGGTGIIPLPPAPPSTVAATGQTNADLQRQTKLVDDLVKSYGDEAKVLGASQGARERARAELEAETFIRDHNLSGLEAETARRQIVSNALLKQATGHRDLSAEIRLEIGLAAQLAQAWLQGTQQGLQADARHQASLEHLKDATVDVASRTRELLNQQAAGAVTSAGPEVDKYRLAAEAQERVAQAARISGAAAHEAEVNNRILAATYELLAKAAQSSDAAIRQQAQTEAASIGKSIRAEDAAQVSTAIETEIRLRKEQIGLEQQVVAASAQGKAERAEALALLRTTLELSRQFPGATQEEVAQLAQANAQYAKLVGQAKEMQQAQQELAATVKESFQAISSGLLSVLTGHATWQKALDGIEQKLLDIGTKALIDKPLEKWFDSLLSGGSGGGGFFDGLLKSLGLGGNAASSAASAGAGATLATAGTTLVTSGTALTSAAAALQVAAAALQAAAAGSAGGGLLSLFTGGGSAAGIGNPADVISGVGADGIPGGVFAKGGVFDRGNVVPFASGGIVDRKSYFSMAGNHIGSIAENGPESIIPLFRNSRGVLGVSSTGGGGDTHLHLHGPLVHVAAGTSQEDHNRARRTANQLAADFADSMVRRGSRAR